MFVSWKCLVLVMMFHLYNGFSLHTLLLHRKSYCKGPGQELSTNCGPAVSEQRKVGESLRSPRHYSHNHHNTRTGTKAQDRPEIVHDHTKTRGIRFDDTLRTFTQLSDQPPNVYTNVDYDYLATNSLFTIKHPSKFSSLGMIKDSVQAYESNDSLIDRMLTKWYDAAKKWGLLAGKLSLKEEGHSTHLVKFESPPDTAAQSVASDLSAESHASMEIGEQADQLAQPLREETETSLLSTNASDVHTTGSQSGADSITHQPQPPSPAPLARLTSALTLRVALLKERLGINGPALEQEVDRMLHSPDASELDFERFGANIMKLTQKSGGARKHRKAKAPSGTAGVGFGAPPSELWTAEREVESAENDSPETMKRLPFEVARRSSPGLTSDFTGSSSSSDIIFSSSSNSGSDNAKHSVEGGRCQSEATAQAKEAAKKARDAEEVVKVEEGVPLALLREICDQHQARVICIGDVHGCVDEVCDLLRAAEFLPGDQVVFLGDLMVKGPKSADVIQLAMDIGALSVRGNHDHAVVKERALLEQAMHRASSSSSIGKYSTTSSSDADETALPSSAGSTGTTPLNKKYNRALQEEFVITTPTVASSASTSNHTSNSTSSASSSYSKMPQHLKVATSLTDAQATWLAALPYFIRSLDLGAVFVHAGFQNNVRLSHQEPWIMMTMRSLLPTGRATSRCMAAHPWARGWRGPLTAYFGHDTARGLQVYPSAYGIDTGCVYGGNLTAVLLPDQTIVSVPARQTYLKLR